MIRVVVDLAAGGRSASIVEQTRQRPDHSVSPGHARQGKYIVAASKRRSRAAASPVCSYRAHRRTAASPARIFSTALTRISSLTGRDFQPDALSSPTWPHDSSWFRPTASQRALSPHDRAAAPSGASPLGRCGEFATLTNRRDRRRRLSQLTRQDAAAHPSPGAPVLAMVYARPGWT